MKKYFTLILLFACWFSAKSQLLMNEPFSYIPNNLNGLNVQSNSVWKNANTGDSILVVSGSLTYPGLAASQGEKVAFDGAGIDNYRTFTAQTSGKVYSSCIFNVASLGLMNTTGTYVISLTEANSTSAFGASIWLKKSVNTGKYNIGISNRSNSPVSYLTADLDTLTSYFVVFSYQIVGGSANDVSTLWLNTTQFGGMEPTASNTAVGGTDLSATGIGRIMLRQPAITVPAPFIQFDEIRVGTTWESVTPCASPVTYYADSDGDTFGNPTSNIQACSQPSGYVTDNTDCDDSNSALNPNSVWYPDADGDGYGVLSPLSYIGCTPPLGYVSNSTDCNDNDFNLNLLTTWYLDLDNDGFGNPNSSIQNCGQPSGYVSNNTDCDDSNASVNLNQSEIADNLDNDCDGLIDEGFSALAWYLDSDQDGFGGLDSLLSILSPGANYTLTDGDCNDTISSINPNALEICDGIDNNCDGLIDNGLTFNTYYVDLDNDGYGNSLDSLIDCSQPNGYVLNNTDCDDGNASLNPGATDIPGNGIDEDCSGADAVVVPVSLGIYEFTQASACPVTATSVTTQPVNALFSEFYTQGTTCMGAANVFNNSGWNITQNIDTSEYNQFSISAADCHLLNLDRIAFNHRCSASGGTPTWHIRSSLDNYSIDIASGLSGNNGNVNLDDTVFLNSTFSGISNVTFRVYIIGIAQSGSTWRMDNVSLYGNILSVTPQAYYADFDGDGFGNINADTLTCIMPQGFVSDNTDCNDLDSLVNPASVWYMDMDGDLIGDSTMSFIGCVPPTGYVLAAGDCDDMNAQVVGPVTYYADNDGDSYGDVATTQVHCQNPGAGFVTVGGDCNDNDALINPSATEICDGIDNDCDGVVDDSLTFVTYFTDADGDGFGFGNGQSLCQNPGSGFVTVGGDCNDNDDQINPSAIEICDGIDNNCDGNIDNGLNFVTYYADADNDGFGTGNGQSLCQNPGAGFVTVNGDCDDTNAQINPNATETMNNGIDENCDGVDGYLGIEVISDLKVSISPNPNQGTFTIQLSENLNNCEIKLMDLSGKQINKYYFSGNKIQIAEMGIDKGVYLIHLSINGNSLVERIIIQ